MSNYTKTTDFAAKDALLTGNPSKLVKGTEINVEFSNIQTAVNSKLDSSGVTAFAATLLDDIDAGMARGTLVAAKSGANADITSMTGLSNGGIPVAKVSGAAASGANADITSLDGVLVGKGAGGISTNTRYGAGALTSNTTGSGNTAIGSSAGTAITTATNTTLIGANAGASLTGSSANTVVGAYSGSNLTSGTDNTFIGCQAGEYATGSANTFVGWLASRYVTGSNNTAVGWGTLSALVAGFNNTAVGHGADAASSSSANSVTLGNSSITALRCAATSISSLSDARDKTDVVDLPCGLSFINTLRPIKFTWAMRDGAKVGIPDFGFIAQELKAAQEAAGAKDWLNLVSEENPEKLEASYGRLLPVMVKAIQELSAKVAALEARV